MENLIYPLLSLIPALLNLGILVYLLFFVPRVKTTDIFCFFVLLLLLWQIEDTIVRLCDTAETALFWVRIFCIGWAGVAPVAFHFACRYTSLKFSSARFAAVCIYLPFVFFYLVYMATSDTTIFTNREGWNWIVTPRPNSLDGLQRLFISGYVLGAIFILFRYAYLMRNQKRKRLQALFVAAGIFIPAVQGIITQIVYPVIFHKPDIPVTSSFLTLFSIATILSMRKYNLFDISESVDVKTVLTNLKSIVLVVSPQQQIIYMNPYACEILGYKETQVEGIYIEAVFSSPASYDAFVTNVFTPSFDGNPIREYATVLSAGEGKKIDVLLSSELISNNKQVQGLLLVATDVTELSGTLRDLEKSNKELERFAYIASHDLQEPLRKITAYLQLLETKYKDTLDEKARAYINVAVRSGSQMRMLIQDLLEYSNISRNQENAGSADMNEVVKKVLKTLAAQIDESGAQIEFTQLPMLYKANKAQMQQVMENLLGNALKYRRSDTNAHIKIRAEDQGEWWKVVIEDNGIGIDPEYREKVFVVFQRLHGKGHYPGTGIGLSICKKIIEQHGGKIWLESNAMGGSTFFFTVPKSSCP